MQIISENDGFLRQAQIIPGLVPVSRATLWRWVKSGHFPAPVNLGGNVTAWTASSVRAWMAKRQERPN